MKNNHTYEENGYPRENNTRLARVLDKSRADELNAISEYLYLSIMFEKSIPWLSKLFEEISMDEMQHFHALSGMMRDLGVNPTVNVKSSSSRLDLMQDASCRCEAEALRVLEDLLRAEKNAENEYLRLRTLAPTMEIKNALTEIAEDEYAHRDALNDALKQFNK